MFLYGDLDKMWVVGARHSVGRSVRWSSPPGEDLKLNVDAAVWSDVVFVVGYHSRRSGSGVSVFGRFLGAHSPFVTECLALKEGLEFARTCNLRVAWIESNAANVVRAVSEQNFDGVDGVLIHDIINFMLDGDGESCSHIS
ncbi:hypothetical protein TIFTF001_017909 [Ficus carica]|uniref:RNase H type-1 domain-containing protein n=1 Tax=Ficus carica TaxID=3494 RepID=A0AA88AD47_FICCA|nr:hypothetical protein TIFTF001_017909 [Ficus carica]